MWDFVTRHSTDTIYGGPAVSYKGEEQIIIAQSGCIESKINPRQEFLSVWTLFYIMSLLMIPHFCRVLVCEAAGFALGRFLLNRRHCGTFRGRNRMLALNFGLDQFLENNGSLIVSLYEKLSIVVERHLVNDLSFLNN